MLLLVSLALGALLCICTTTLATTTPTIARARRAPTIRVRQRPVQACGPWPCCRLACWTLGGMGGGADLPFITTSLPGLARRPATGDSQDRRDTGSCAG